MCIRDRVQALMKQLKPTLPVMLANLVTVQQVVTVRLDALEQLLVTFPRMIASGFSGTPGDGFGHINMQLGADAPQPCRKGYLPPSKWRQGNDTSEAKPYYAAHCASRPPYNMRGTKYAPGYRGGNASPGRAYGSSSVSYTHLTLPTICSV